MPWYNTRQEKEWHVFLAMRHDIGWFALMKNTKENKHTGMPHSEAAGEENAVEQAYRLFVVTAFILLAIVLATACDW